MKVGSRVSPARRARQAKNFKKFDRLRSGRRGRRRRGPASRCPRARRRRSCSRARRRSGGAGRGPRGRWTSAPSPRRRTGAPADRPGAARRSCLGRGIAPLQRGRRQMEAQSAGGRRRAGRRPVGRRRRTPRQRPVEPLEVAGRRQARNRIGGGNGGVADARPGALHRQRAALPSRCRPDRRKLLDLVLDLAAVAAQTLGEPADGLGLDRKAAPAQRVSISLAALPAFSS